MVMWFTYNTYIIVLNALCFLYPMNASLRNMDLELACQRLEQKIKKAKEQAKKIEIRKYIEMVEATIEEHILHEMYQ